MIGGVRIPASRPGIVPGPASVPNGGGVPGLGDMPDGEQAKQVAARPRMASPEVRRALAAGPLEVLSMWQCVARGVPCENQGRERRLVASFDTTPGTVVLIGP